MPEFSQTLCIISREISHCHNIVYPFQVFISPCHILTSGHPRQLMETSEICQAFSSLLSLLFFGESCRDVVPIKGKMCADCGAVVILLEYPTTRGMTDINLTVERFINSTVWGHRMSHRKWNIC